MFNSFQINKIVFSICNTFDEMSLKISGIPHTIAELVGLQNYVIECRDVTMYHIKERIRQTVEYVIFLMQYAHLSGWFKHF